MNPLIQELDRAIERGWADGGHLAALRELARESANEPATVGDSLLSRAEAAWERYWNERLDVLHGRHAVRECLRYVLECCLPVERAVSVPVVDMATRARAVGHD